MRGALAQITTRLRNGIPGSELHPAFDKRATIIYALALLDFGVGFALIHYLGFRLPPEIFAMSWLQLALPLCGMLLRRIGHPRAATALETVTLFYVVGIASFFTIIPLCAISLPLADAKLAAIDAAFGFDWAALAHAMQPYQRWLLWFYTAFNWQPLVILAFMLLQRQEDRAWTFLTAAMVSLALSVAIFPLAPAHGAFAYYNMNPGDFPLLKQFPYGYAQSIDLYKFEGLREFRIGNLGGLISFPSEHAAWAAIFVYGAWANKWTRWVFLPLNVGMTFAALLVGGHYLIDVLAGLLIGTLSVVLARSYVLRVR